MKSRKLFPRLDVAWVSLAVAVVFTLTVLSLVSLVRGQPSVFEPTPPAGNNQPNLTNLTMVTSVDVPMGAWFTNNIGDGASLTAANFASISNAGDGMILAHTNGTASVTNCIRTRFALPWDWNAGTVKLGLVSVCSGTNSPVATNIVYAVRAVALGQNDNVTSPSWGTLVRTTNNVSTNLWVQGSEAITAVLTVGNTPAVAKDILWEIQRHGGDGGDTETNANLFLARVRVYYQRSSRSDFPVSSP